MKTKILCIALAGLLSAATSAFAQLITPISVTGSGTYVGNASRVANGVIPAEGSSWMATTNVRWSWPFTPSFTLDYGALFLINDVLASVDNNDNYLIEYSKNGTSFTNLFTVQSGYGEIGSGMDTFSSDSASSEYVGSIDFAPVTARYLRIRGTAGDGLYAVGELQAFGSPVPEPSTYGLFGALALTGLVYWRRRARR